MGDGIDGFVLAAPNVFGEFGYTSDVTEALKVRIGCGGEALDIATLVCRAFYLLNSSIFLSVSFFISSHTFSHIHIFSPFPHANVYS